MSNKLFKQFYIKVRWIKKKPILKFSLIIQNLVPMYPYYIQTISKVLL